MNAGHLNILVLLAMVLYGIVLGFGFAWLVL